MKPIVIQTENLPQECSDWLAERCDLHICPADSLRFKELLPKAQGLAIRTYTSVDCAMLEAAPNLKVVGRAGVGVDNIDLQSCNERGVTVVHTPEANSESVVEFVLTTMLSQLRALHYVTSAVSQKEWNALRDASVNQNEFSETTIGIIGFGRIGSRLGKMAKRTGMGGRNSRKIRMRTSANSTSPCGVRCYFYPRGWTHRKQSPVQYSNV